MTRSALLFAALAAALLLSALLSVSVGSAGIPPGEALRALWNGGDDTAARIVRELRLPRALLAMLVGGCLSMAGVVFQALLRNPLADPYVLGVSGGAAVGALGALLLLPAGVFLPLPVSAFAGAACASAFVFLLARRGGGVGRERLVLMGVVVGAFLNAIIMMMIAFAPPGKIPGALHWLMGDLGQGTNARVLLLLPYAAGGAALLLGMSRGLDLLLLGDEAAFHAGLPVERTKTALFLVASLLAGSVVAVSGLIGFVGLVVPHGARVLAGASHRRLLPAAALMGAAFLTLADVAARSLSPSGELPVGAVTALAGAPFFLALLRGRKGAA